MINIAKKVVGNQFFVGLLVVIFLIAFLHLNFNSSTITATTITLPSSPIAPEIDPRTLALYQSQVSLRKAYLKSVPERQDYFILYNTLVPEVLCKDLVRIGTIGDGGKWICNPSQIRNLPECVIYSLGINNEPSFEESFQNFTDHKCLLRSLDKDAQAPVTMKRIASANGVFMKALIAGKTNKVKATYTFRDVLKEFGDTQVDVLKIDIEGGEFDIQDELISVPICQILIEIHGKTAKKTLELLQKFSRAGYYLFSYEINGAWHQLSEYSFIHERCLKDYGVNTIYGKYLS